LHISECCRNDPAIFLRLLQYLRSPPGPSRGRGGTFGRAHPDFYLEATRLVRQMQTGDGVLIDTWIMHRLRRGHLLGVFLPELPVNHPAFVALSRDVDYAAISKRGSQRRSASSLI
jgi:hypothetical protein